MSKRMTELPHKILEQALRAGLDSDEGGRSATYMHVDQDTVYSAVNDAFEGKLEMMDVKDALKKHDWVRDLMWKAVPEDADETTRTVAKDFSGGYFMHILEDADLEFPLQSCLMMTQKNVKQRVHNIIVSEKGSNARIISGCVTDPQVGAGSHLGISEFYIREGASLNFTMIHNWGEKTRVRPKSAAIVESDATFVSNYICLQPVADLKMYPRAICEGERSRASFNNIIYCGGQSKISAGSMVELKGRESRAEIIARVIAKEGAQITSPGRLIALNDKVKAHMECAGLLLDDEAVIHAIPELRSERKDVDMSHEAAVGRIADKEINYLMSRGLTRDEATSMIVRGFLDVDILGLPQDLRDEVEKIVDSMVDTM